MTLTEFLGRLEGMKGGGGQYTALCPSHGDRRNSLSVSVGKDGQVLLHCHAGCEPQAVAEAMGLTMRDLFTEITPGEALPHFKGDHAKQDRPPIVATYVYRDESGKLLAQKLRRADKSFLWRHPDSAGNWVWSRKGVPNVLYNLPVISTVGTLWVVEGEKDVDTLTGQNQPAVCGADGAGPGKWIPAYTEALRGKKVIVVQDNDEVGKAFAAETANALYGVAQSVKLLDLTRIWPGLPEHGDTTDLYEHMGPDGIAAMVAAAMDTPEWEPTDQETKERPCLNVISAPDLQRAQLPPIKFIVEGILPEGTSLVSAASKIGKSWMVLDLGLCSAGGNPFMGHRTNQCGVLYLALEDSLNRLQDRMNKILGGKPAPPQFYFTTEAPPLDSGLLDMLDDHVKKHPDTKLIIIDTLQKVRGQALPREQAYAQDYREMGTIKAHMAKMGVSVFFVHHNRKMRDDDDPFNMISGTNGIMGAADTIWTITKDKRADDSATLHITGRDVAQSDTVVKFNKETWRWEAVGDADLLAEQRARLEYDGSPIVKTVKKLLAQSPEHRWDGTAQELLDAGKYIVQTYLAYTPRDLTNKLKPLDKPLFDYDGIIHDRAKHGTGGGKHKFYYQNLAPVEDVEQEELPFS